MGLLQPCVLGKLLCSALNSRLGNHTKGLTSEVQSCRKPAGAEKQDQNCPKSPVILDPSRIHLYYLKFRDMRDLCFNFLFHLFLLMEYLIFNQEHKVGYIWGQVEIEQHPRNTKVNTRTPMRNRATD